MKKKYKQFYFIIAFVLSFCMFSEVITYGAEDDKKITIQKLKVEYNGEKAKEVPGCVIDGKAYVKLVEICAVTDRALAYDKQEKKYNYIIVPKDYNWSSASEALGYVEISKNKNSECGKTFDKIKIEKLAIDNGFGQSADAFFINGQPYVKLVDYTAFKGRKMELKYESKGKKYVLTYKNATASKPTATPTPKLTVTPKPTTEPKKNNEITFEEQVVYLVNKERAKEGLNALKIVPALEKGATIRVREIVTLFSHTRPDGNEFRTVLTEVGNEEWDSEFADGWGEYATAFASENIAYGKGCKTPEDVMDLWMNSPGHKKNILRADSDSIGVGFYQYNGFYYWVQLFFQDSEYQNFLK